LRCQQRFDVGREYCEEDDGAESAKRREEGAAVAKAIGHKSIPNQAHDHSNLGPIY
jgi:hypothetical protein